MKLLKRLAIGLTIFVVLIVAALLVAPILFKDQIVEKVRTSANGMVDAEVDFSDIDVSFLRSFPDVSVRVHDLSVIGIDTFAGLPLMTADELGVDLGFWSVVAGDGRYNVDGVTVDEPNINLVVINPDLANYLIVPESTDAPTAPADPAAAPLTVTLDHFELNNGTFVYDDRSTDTYIKIVGLNTSGDGDFTTTVFDLDTYSEADALTFSQDGVTYLDEVEMVADAIVNVDSENFRYTFKENVITLNALDLEFDGSIDLEDNDDILLDLSFRAPGADFRQAWSMVPAAYTEGYEQVKTTGTFTLDGSVEGTFNSVTEQYPAFTVNADIADGSVQYPGRPVRIDGINAAVNVSSPSADLDRMKINIPRFNLNLGGDPFAGSFALSTPLSDPNVDASLKGKIDLNKWASAIPLEGVQELGGLIVADVLLENVRQSTIDAGNYGGINMDGDMSVTDLVYVTDDLPPVRIPTATADFTPQAINVPNFSANLGRSDLAGSASITTPLAYFNPDQTMRGDVKMQSDFFDADEWVTESTVAGSPAELSANSAETATATEPTEVFDRFDFTIDAAIKELRYGTYRPTNLRAVGNIKPNKLDIGTAEGQLGESSFNATGAINNLFDYTFDGGVLNGDLTVRSPFLDMADFMTDEATVVTEDASTPAGEAAAVPIPDNINLAINLRADRVKYDDIDLTDMAGKLLLQGGQAVLEDGTTKLFGGRMDFAGAYDTTEPGEPGFRFHYDMESIDFGSAFDKLNSFAALAPVGKFLSGKFNTDLVLEGKLGEDLFPKLGSIDAKGLFETVSANINGLAPLQKIGQALNVKELKNSTTVRNIMTVFSIEDGRVEIEPFDLEVANIPMQIAGSHGLSQEMSYTIRAAIPREMIAGNVAGSAALSAIDALAGQAAKLGLNIEQGDVINVQIGLTGDIQNPKTKFNFLGTDGNAAANPRDALAGAAKDRVNQELEDREAQAREAAEQQLDAAKDRAQAEADRLKAEAGNQAKAIQDSIARVAQARADDLKAQAEQKLRMRLDSVRLDSLKNVLPDAVTKPADQLKEELGKFNPFKKKTRNKENN